MNAGVLIEFHKETVESQDSDYSIDDLLEASGTLSPDRAKELLEVVDQSREEANLFFRDYRMRSVCRVKTQ